MSINDDIQLLIDIENNEVNNMFPDIQNLKPTQSVKVKASKISDNLKIFLNSFFSILEDQSGIKSKYYVDEIEINLGITANGGIEFVGKISSGTQVGLKVKIKKTADNQSKTD